MRTTTVQGFFVKKGEEPSCGGVFPKRHGSNIATWPSKPRRETEAELASNLQTNVERVLDLEQSDRSELVGKPIPKDSPRGRRPGDGEPGKRPGCGNVQVISPGMGLQGCWKLVQVGKAR